MHKAMEAQKRSPIWSGAKLLPLAVGTSLCILAFVDRNLFDRVAYYAGVSWGQLPFFDVFTPLSWYECAQKGVDITVGNPCDTRSDLKFPISYPPGWLWFNFDGLDTGYTDLIGIAWGGIFLASLLLLPPLRSGVAAVAFLAAALSNASLFGIYQANFDIVVLAAVVIAVRLAVLGGAWAFIAYALLVFLALLKIYPAIALALVLRERMAVALAVCLGAVAVFVAHVYANLEGWQLAVAMIPWRDPISMFGLRNLAKGLPVLWGSAAGSVQVIGGAYATMLLLCGALGFAFARRLSADRVLDRLTEVEILSLLAGLCVILFCFVSAQNFRYRAIFIILTVPPLSTMWSAARDRRLRSLLLLAMGTSIASMWGVFVLSAVDHFQKAAYSVSTPPDTLLRSVVWTLREVCWWIAMSMFAAVLSLVLRKMRAFAEFEDWLRSIAAVRRTG